MKKNLLLAIAAGVVLNASAQNQKAINSNSQKLEKLPLRGVALNANDFAKSFTNPIKTKKNRLNNVSRTAATLDIAIGQAPNAYSITGGPRTFLWADPTLNAITFSHRAKLSPATNSGTFVYDVSKDGGATWTINKGPVYLPASNNPGNSTASIGRYPQGVIYNPTGNTVADSAYFTYFAPTLDNSNGIIQPPNGAFGGLATGIVQFDGTDKIQHQTSSNKVGTERQFRAIPESFFMTQQGVSWGLSINVPLIGQKNIYNDSISLYKGVFNGADMVYTHQFLQAPLSTEGSDGAVVAGAIAFAPDGQNGWIALMAHDKNITADEDSIWYPVLYKTVDGGATWTGPTKVCVGRLNEVVNQLPTAGLDQNLYYTGAFEIDLAVDFYGNPHMNLSIGTGLIEKTKPAGAPATWTPSPSWSFPSAVGNWAQFAVYSLDQGVNFQAELLNFPGEFRGCYGDCPSGTDRLQEDLRGQVSTSWDGKKVFYSWFETDTVEYGTTDGNKYPDLWTKGVDVGATNATWGRSINLTPSGADGRGSMTFGNVSYYVLEGTPNVYEIPASYQVINNGDVTAQVDYHYIQGATYEFDTTHVVTIDTMRAECTTRGPVGIKKNPAVVGSSVAVYPNPTNSIANINYTLAKSSTVTIELYSILGTQVAVIAANENQSVGAHTVALDMNKLNTGVYFLRSTINGESKVTKITKN